MTTSRESFDHTMKPEHISQILQIGRRQTYELLQNPPFRVIRLGGRGDIKIPRDPFFDWFEGRQPKQG